MALLNYQGRLNIHGKTLWLETQIDFSGVVIKYRKETYVSEFVNVIIIYS